MEGAGHAVPLAPTGTTERPAPAPPPPRLRGPLPSAATRAPRLLAAHAPLPRDRSRHTSLPRRRGRWVDLTGRRLYMRPVVHPVSK